MRSFAINICFVFYKNKFFSCCCSHFFVPLSSELLKRKMSLKGDIPLIQNNHPYLLVFSAVNMSIIFVLGRDRGR